jgi:hypothetical protein
MAGTEMEGNMEEMQEFAGHLKAQLLNVREDLRTGQIEAGDALRKIRAIQRRARSGNGGHLRYMQTSNKVTCESGNLFPA